MVAPGNALSIEEKPSDARQRPPCNLLRVPLFLVTILYGQLMHGLCTLLLLLGIRVCPHTGGDHVLGLLGARFATAANSHAVIDDTQSPVVFLCNHRSWGDFLLDAALLGSPSFVSRWLVALGIPMTAAQ